MTKEQIRVWKHTQKWGVPQGPKESQQLQETKIGVHVLYFETEEALERSNSMTIQTTATAAGDNAKSWEAG